MYLDASNNFTHQQNISKYLSDAVVAKNSLRMQEAQRKLDTSEFELFKEQTKFEQD